MEHSKIDWLQGYDYAQNGVYFITVCTQNRYEWFWRNNVVGADTIRPYNIHYHRTDEALGFQANRISYMAEIFSRPHHPQPDGIPTDLAIHRRKSPEMGVGLLLSSPKKLNDQAFLTGENRLCEII